MNDLYPPAGDTEDQRDTDLAVGGQGDQFKNGSITQSERFVKLNRLLEIATELPVPVTSWPAPATRTPPDAAPVSPAALVSPPLSSAASEPRAS